MELFEDYQPGRRGAYDEMFHDGELRAPYQRLADSFSEVTGPEVRARAEALRNAARIAVTSYPTASQIAADRAAGQRSQARFATDAKRPASRPDAFDAFANRWPDAARIRPV